MKLKLDLSRLDFEVSHYEMTEAKRKWEENRQLFIDITENWESENDIDYSIPISALVDLIENTAVLIRQKQEFSEMLDEVSRRVEDSKLARIRPRLL